MALITVHDLDRRNAVIHAMSAQLRAVVVRAEADAALHAVVVTGAGRAFCAGADLSTLGVATEAAVRHGLALQVADNPVAAAKEALGKELKAAADASKEKS